MIRFGNLSIDKVWKHGLMYKWMVLQYILIYTYYSPHFNIFMGESQYSASL